MAHHAEGVQHVGLLLNCYTTTHCSTIPSGCSTVSSDEKVVVVSNLYDGLDWYKIPDRAFSRSVPIRIAKNVIIPVHFVDGDALLITGGTSGMAKVLDACTAETIQTLDHDCTSCLASTPADFLTGPTDTADDMIQAIVCCPTSLTFMLSFFRRTSTRPRRLTQDTSQLALRVEDRSYTSGFPRLNPSQNPQLNLLPSPLHLPHQGHPKTQLRFLTTSYWGCPDIYFSGF